MIARRTAIKNDLLAGDIRDQKTVSVDRKHKLIRNWMAETAKVHDSQHLEAVLDDWNTSAEIYADKGYVGEEREARLREQGIGPRFSARGSQASRYRPGRKGGTGASLRSGLGWSTSLRPLLRWAVRVSGPSASPGRPSPSA